MAKVCEKCGSTLAEGTDFCEACGAYVPRVTEEESSPAQPEAKAPAPKAPKEELPKRSKRPIILAIVAIVASISVIVIMAWLLNVYGHTPDIEGLEPTAAQGGAQVETLGE